MDLRTTPVSKTLTLADGRAAEIRIGVPADPYIAKEELDTVALELHVDGMVAATLNTVLGADDLEAARELAREAADGLASGDLVPTAGALEPLVDRLR